MYSSASIPSVLFRIFLFGYLAIVVQRSPGFRDLLRLVNYRELYKPIPIICFPYLAFNKIGFCLTHQIVIIENLNE